MVVNSSPDRAEGWRLGLGAGSRDLGAGAGGWGCGFDEGSRRRRDLLARYRGMTRDPRAPRSVGADADSDARPPHDRSWHDAAILDEQPIAFQIDQVLRQRN